MQPLYAYTSSNPSLLLASRGWKKKFLGSVTYTIPRQPLSATM
jgi:hypothetical protein